MEFFIVLTVLGLILWLLFKAETTQNTALKNTQKVVSSVTKTAIKGTTKTTWEGLKYAARFTNNKFQKPSIQYGAARFLTVKESKKILDSKNVGLSINGTKKQTLSQDNSFKHLLLVAPSGTGKTTSYVVPSILLQLQQGGSIVVTDPSGEIFNLTSAYARQQGYEIKVFNVSQHKESLTYNPILHANTHRDIANLARILVESAFESNSNNSFWNDGASTIIELLIQLLKAQPLKYQNLANVRYLLNNFGLTGDALFPLFSQSNINQSLFTEFQSFLNQEPKILHGFLSTAKTALKSFTDTDLCQLTATDSLDFRVLRKKPTILYIICQESLIPHYSFMLKILYSQLFSFVMEGLQSDIQPIYMYMDEFGNIGKINDFNTILTTIRKYGVSISLILQDIQQLTNIYGHTQASIIMNGGTSSKLFLSGMSHTSCQEVSNLLGNATIEDVNKWTQRKSAAYGRALLTPQEIRTLKQGLGIFIHGSELPIQLKMVPFYQNKRLNKLTKLPIIPFITNPLQPVAFLPLPPPQFSTSSNPSGNSPQFPSFDL